MLSTSVKGPFTGDIDSTEMLHDVMRYMPYNRRTLTAMRCVSKPFRSAVQKSNSPWAGHKDIMLSRFGQCVIFNAHEDEEGKSAFRLYSVSPIGRKFRNSGAKLLARNAALIANGLTMLALHHSQIEDGFFEPLGALVNLRELELVACRGINSVGDAKRIKGLERLEVAFCPLGPDGVQGLHLPRLKKLTIRSCHGLSNLNGIAAETAASLEELTVENCNVYDDTTEVFFSHFTANLRELHLCSTHIDTALARIPESARANGLVTLHVADTPLTAETLAEIAPSMGQRLEFLSLENCTDLETFAAIEDMKALRFLDVSRADISDGLDAVALLPNIELYRMANSEIENISYLSALQNLRVLDAAFSSVTDFELMYLEGAPALDTVILTACIYVSNVNVLRTCPCIRRIFCARTAVNNEGVSLLVECDHLEELVLKLTSITDANLLAGIRSLKSINVCSTVGSIDGVQALLERRDLEVLCDTFEGDDYMDN